MREGHSATPQPTPDAVKPTAILLLFAALPTLACSSQSGEAPVNAAPSAGAAQPNAPAAEAHSRELASSTVKGKILETMNSGGYTYALIDTGTEEIWAATSQVAVAVGDPVTIVNPMVMPHFHSSTLDRTFDRVLFTDSFSGGAAAADPHSGMMSSFHGGQAPMGGADLEEIAVEPAEGGVTVEEVFRRRDELVGKEIVLRGQVVKYNAQILDVNWLHLRDGSGEDGTNDLTVTTTSPAAVGDVVTIRGKLIANKDYGSGYKYDLIVENAEIAKE